MKRALSISIALWVMLIAASLFWNIQQNRKHHLEMLFQTARSFFHQIEITREWNASHGGIYAPVTANTRPNPFLKQPMRDLYINSSLTLTKINPAFMTRQIADIAKKYNNTQFHITSLKPIRPENQANELEQSALLIFDAGLEKEIGKILSSNSGDTFFYMAPLVTRKPCLTCHAEQGYKEGDIRGGISITLPISSSSPLLSIILEHLFIGLAGLSGIVFFGMKLSNAYLMVKNQAVIDALTGVPNRRNFTERILEEVNRHKRQKEPLSVLMCDIDNFKGYNDTYGHSAGDNCLLQIAQTIKKSLRRPSDFCARYGGEEFVIILPATSATGALSVAVTIIENIRELNIVHINSPPALRVTVSIGVATSETEDATSHETLIKQADIALYHAKSSGRNCVKVFWN